jgi:topoisomerase-4 subunit A
MEWTDEGIVLGVRRHGESSAIVELLTRSHLRDALEERYLAYALSTIMHRALPDARDGLKPVHRRILYACGCCGSIPARPSRNRADRRRRDGQIPSAWRPVDLRRAGALAQDFAQRYPLVDGQGNFGNIDGDNAAAMRYTEARMTEVARLLLDGIDEDAVDFRPPTTARRRAGRAARRLPEPARQRLAGIAVGMATSIPPHNAAELCDAALHLIDKPDATSKAAEIRQGPGFPDRRHHRRFAPRSPKPMRPAAARSACARGWTGGSGRGHLGRSSSPRSPGWCRSRG